MFSRDFMLLLAVAVAECVISGSIRAHQPWKAAVPMLQRVVQTNVNFSGDLVSDTDRVLAAIRYRYDRIALYYDQNNIKDKYIQSVVYFFVLSFMREYSTNTASYGVTYEKVLKSMRQFSNTTAVEIATPVRRHLDIFKSVLATPTSLVYKHCRTDEPAPDCSKKYFAASFLESMKCPTVFYHDAIFTKTREFIERYEVDHERILEQILDQAKSFDRDISQFQAILLALEMFKTPLKEHLEFLTRLHAVVAYYQQEDKLRCFEVYRDPV